MNPKTKRAGELKPGQMVWLAGMLMRFAHFYGPTPIFRHVAKGPEILYENHSLTADSMIEVIN